jgi:hypothetical protein
VNGITYTGNAALKNKIMRCMQEHDLVPGLSPYQLTWAPGARSGWSFGWMQFDLASGNSFGLNTFAKVLLEAKDASGNFTIDDGDPHTGRGTPTSIGDVRVRDLYVRAQLRPNQLTVADIYCINNALESTAGRQIIDDSVDLYLDVLIAWANNAANMTPSHDRPFLQSDLGLVWLIILKNNNGFDIPGFLKEFR